MEFYIMEDRLKRGPFTLDELRRRGITPQTSVMRVDSSVWQAAGDVPELAGLFAYAQPGGGPQQFASQNANTQYQQYGQQPNQQAYGMYGGGNNMPPMPKTYLVESILVTLLCCLPFGIVGIVNATNVDTAYYAGNYQEALRKSMNAKKWALWGVIASLICWVLYILVYVVIFAGVGLFAAAGL